MLATQRWPDNWLRFQKKHEGLPLRLQKGDRKCSSCGLTRTPENTRPVATSRYICMMSRCTDCVKIEANERNKRMRHENPEKHRRLKFYQIDYKESRRGAILAMCRNALRNDATKGYVHKRLQAADIEWLLEEQDERCASCNVKMIVGGPKSPQKCSIDRIHNELAHERGNIRLTCMSCNLGRRMLSVERWQDVKRGDAPQILAHCGKLVSGMKERHMDGPKTATELYDIIESQDFRCARTGLPFSFKTEREITPSGPRAFPILPVS